ncbi:hypothetical protein CO704_09480 [Cedecea neteri]|uniref:Uncharacterized protein n=1 Tax=Cedecea neteri TaxID=158822 RepID=A0A291DWU4_9ENTR|nr:hypothetical protein CO704_09480 [Cedecea neteri]
MYQYEKLMVTGRGQASLKIVGRLTLRESGKFRRKFMPKETHADGGFPALLPANLRQPRAG